MKFTAFIAATLMSLCNLAGSSPFEAQDITVAPPASAKAEEAAKDVEPKPAEKVAVKPAVRDDEIERRLTDILEATNWFRVPLVAVDEGVVFITGFTAIEAYKTWASNLAMNTQDVVAVVNRIQVDEPPIFDLSGIIYQLREMGRSIVLGLPFLLFSVVLIPITWMSARLARKLSARLFETSISSDLLRDVASRTVGILVFFIGLYLLLKVSGLSRLAVTVLGSTGVVGLAVGIAFREITENFLASIYLSINKPFRIGDFITVADLSGYVQGLTARTTILMTAEGNHLQIPNAIVFKSVIRNFTSNPNQRLDFTLPISIGTRISFAQEVAMRVLRDHPAVLEDPEPLVLVNDIDEVGIRLRIYFWVDCIRHSLPKVRSSAIRLTRTAFRDHGILFVGEASSPFEVQLEESADQEEHRYPQGQVPQPAEPVVSSSEGSLASDAESIEEQTLRARVPEEGQNLLEADDGKVRQPEPKPPQTDENR